MNTTMLQAELSRLILECFVIVFASVLIWPLALSLPRIARRGWVILFLGLGSWGLISFWEHFHRVSTP